MTAYAELQVTSNFSFLRGGSHPEELVLRAAELGLSAIALTDRNTLAGVVRAHVAAKEVGIRFVVGARLDLMPKATSSLSPPSFPNSRKRSHRLLQEHHHFFVTSGLFSVTPGLDPGVHVRRRARSPEPGLPGQARQ